MYCQTSDNEMPYSSPQYFFSCQNHLLGGGRSVTPVFVGEKNLDLCVCLPVCICLCTPKYIHPHHSLYDFTYKFRSTRSALKSTTFSSKYFCFYFTQLQKRLLVRGVKKWLWKFVLFGMKFFLCYATIQTPLDCMILLGLTMKLKICFCQSLLMIQFRG